MIRFIKRRIVLILSLVFLVIFLAFYFNREKPLGPFNFILPKQPPCILIQPFEGVHKSNIDTVKKTLELYYDAKVIVAAPTKLPNEAFYHPRQRYRADSLIRFLKKIKPDSVDKIIGLTHKDISTTKGKYKDYGIQGLAFLKGPSCVVSSYRLQKYARGNSKTFYRSLKIVSRHEMGHTFGLKHCEDSEDCFMISSRGGARTIKQAKLTLCKHCLQRMKKSKYLFKP